MPASRSHLRVVVLAVTVLALAVPAVAQAQRYGPVGQAQHRDIVIASDMWSKTPRIMGISLNFADIIAVPGLDTGAKAAQSYDDARAAVLAAGGAWNDDVQCVEHDVWRTMPWAFTTAIGQAQYESAWGESFDKPNMDVVQVQFSWPPRPSTLDGSDFEVTLNTGRIISNIRNASVGPNFEYNEGTTVVLNDERLGNRLPKSDPAAIYPVSLKVIRDTKHHTPLQLVGQNGRLVSAIGMTGTNDRTPYDTQSTDPTKWTGPRMIAAKLTHMSARGENGPRILSDGLLPNDGVTIFGAANAQYRVRIATIGGAFSPNGLSPMFPNDYRKFFQLVARSQSGKLVSLIQADHQYRIDGEPITVVGIADRTIKATPDQFNECLQDDSENQIDIILKGSEAAMRKLVSVRIPAKGNGYHPLYNDGGPGSTPTAGVRYTAPGPRQTMQLINGLDNPLQATFVRLK